MAIKLTSLHSIDPKCRLCNGKCWHPGDQKATQTAAAKMFGYPIPNDCVTNNKNTEIRCPKALGLI